MVITERVKKLHRLSLETRPALSGERAKLLTAFYQRHANPMESIPVMRARAFYYLLEHKTIWIGDGELIVGEKGDAPKAAPTYPELCCHTLDDLDQLHSREKIPFHVSEETRAYYESDAIPFWQGRTLR